MGLLDGRIAIVTGAGTGLGRSHSLALAAAGASVMVNNRVSDPAARPTAEIVAEEIAAAGGQALVDTSSVADWDAMGALVARTVEELGRLDIVVNNAGIIGAWQEIADTDEAAYDELLSINLKGAFGLTRHACAHWRAAANRGERVTGRIINTTSGIGLFGFPQLGLYAASKGGTISLTMIAAMEMRRHGVTANVIWPEARTRMGKGIFPDAPEDPDAFDPYDPDNISPLVVYLASEPASWVTGQVYYIQGDRVQRIAGWRVDGEYHSASGRRLESAELADALPLLHHALPALQPGTRLVDAIVGIDPNRPA
jgi:NAD(P)-dependent dehydrogenase (short-subunit alcohol dehydrogenase family)